MNVYVQTHDNGIYLIEAYQELFNKYWPDQPVVVLGYKEPEFELVPNFLFVSLGEDKGPKIGGQLIDYFSGVAGEQFIYTVYSQFIIKPVNIQLLHWLLSECFCDRIALTGDIEVNQPYSAIEQYAWNDYTLVEHSQISNARLSAIWSVWKKDYFLKYLEPDMDLWEWETAGSQRAKMDGAEIFSTFGQYVVTPCRVTKRGRLHHGSFKSWDKYGAEMTQEDQEIVQRVVRGPVWKEASGYVSN